jgi:hypothetical protein
VECSRGSRVRGRIDLWLFVPLVIVLSIVLDVYCLGHSRLFFYTDMLLNLSHSAKRGSATAAVVAGCPDAEVTALDLFFTRICCLIYLKTYRNIVCLKDSFVPT